MIVKKLEWFKLESQFSSGWMTKIEGFRNSYYVWVDRESGKTHCMGLDGQKTLHDTVEKAKQWSEEDFYKKINNLLEDRFLLWLSDQIKNSPGIATLTEMFKIILNEEATK